MMVDPWKFGGNAIRSDIKRGILHKNGDRARGRGIYTHRDIAEGIDDEATAHRMNPVVC
jgi:hypothetical protein